MLVKYIQKDTGLSDNACKKLIDICESNYGRILLEIDKLKFYLQAVDPTGDDLSWDRGFQRLLNDGAIYQPPNDAIFDFVDAVLRKQVDRVFKLLQESYDCGESAMVLLQVLYTNVKQMLQVQSCNSNDICKSTGLTAWQVKCAKERIGKWKIGELIRLLKDIRYSEKGIKTGQVEEQFAVEYALLRNF